jgi:AbiV family abortive infection protein
MIIDDLLGGIAMGIPAEIQQKLVAKDQLERLKACCDMQSLLMAKGPSLVAAPDYKSTAAKYARLVSHAEGLWSDACQLYLCRRFATALALSITCLEEIGKVSVARLELQLSKLPRLAEAFRSSPESKSPGRKGNPFYSHTQKLLLAAGAGALVNSRLDRLLGIEVVASFLDDVDADKIEHLRQACLYSDTKGGQLYLPSEQIQDAQARLYIVLAGEVLAEVAGADPTEWERILNRVKEFEKQIGQPFE